MDFAARDERSGMRGGGSTVGGAGEVAGEVMVFAGGSGDEGCEAEHEEVLEESLRLKRRAEMSFDGRRVDV